VTAGGVALGDVGAPDIFNTSEVNAYYTNASIQITFIKIFDTAADLSISVRW
jgi:alpha-glucosidase